MNSRLLPCMTSIVWRCVLCLLMSQAVLSDVAQSSVTDTVAEQPVAVTLVDGWVRASLPNAENSVAFLTLHNLAATAKQLISVGCTVAKHCELHQHTHSNGKMKMEKVDKLLLPPGESVVLASGGYHVMLIGVFSPLVAGAQVELVFDFDDQTHLRATLPVKSVQAE